MEEKTIEKKEDKVIELKGKVCNCDQLYVRTAPNSKSTYKCIIKKDDVVTVNEKKSTSEWFKVCTKEGVEGFCMKKYITKE